MLPDLASIPTDDPSQTAVRRWFMKLGSGEWFHIYTSAWGSSGNLGTFCALAPPSYRPEALRDPSWDLTHGPNHPAFFQASDGNQARLLTYHRFGSEPLEPLVLDRGFDGLRPAYVELSEEFRLFHNLFADTGTGDLIKFDKTGNATVAAKIRPNHVSVLTPLLREYQAAKQLDLLLFIDSVVKYDAERPSPKREDWTTEDVCGTLHSGDLDGQSFSRFLATRVIPPPPLEEAGIWPFESADNYFPEFIIGTDANGKPRRYTCEPDKLSNNFGSNPGAPNYLTPIHFRREVLAKYYARSDMYTVEDGYLRCGGLWGLRMDNDAPDSVVVWLGDLGRDLPAAERDYWRSFNVAPTGRMSETVFRRAILGEFADAQSVDLRFRVAYGRVIEKWRHGYGWPLFLDPEPGDAHLLDTVHRPLHDTDAEFEDLVLTLTRLLVDPLNEAELSQSISAGPEGEKGISKLNRWLADAGYPEREQDITFLRDIQAVRSAGAAHRKGAGYEKTLDRAVGANRKAAAGNDLLVRGLAMLQDLADFASATGAGPASTDRPDQLTNS